MGGATENDAKNMLKLHHTFYKMDKKFKESIEDDKKQFGYSPTTEP